MGVNRTRVNTNLFLRKSTLRTGEELIGDKDSSNTVFSTPEEFVYDLPGDGFYFEFFRNGQLQVLGKEYSILLSGGNGVGVKVTVPPRPHEILLVNFISAE